MFSMVTVVHTQTRKPPEFHQSCQRPSRLLRDMQVEQRVQVLPSTVRKAKAGPLLSHAVVTFIWLGLRKAKEPN